jgi:uncharacterized protein
MPTRYLFFIAVIVIAADLRRAPAQSAPSATPANRILAGAKEEARLRTPYVMEYEVLKYPGGDVTPGTGVCTDLVIRAFRAAGIDLQKEVAADRVANPSAYPVSLWPNKKADRNIDHRRCPNLVAYFRRHIETLPITLDKQSLNDNWLPGDVVFYVYEGASHPWHVAIVSDRRDGDGMPFIIDAYPPVTSESHRLDEFAPIHSHFRLTASGPKKASAKSLRR